MGRDGNALTTPTPHPSLPDYETLGGEVPVLHAPRLSERAREIQDHLAHGSRVLSEILTVEPPQLTAMLVADEDWPTAPRETARPYPPGLPYFTRSVEPPALVLPEELSLIFQPRTLATFPLAVWHELAHAFLLGREVVRTPVWLGELVPQAAAVAVARRSELPIEEHLARIEDEPGFTVRSFGGCTSTGDQMTFQNLLLGFGAAALDEFGESFLKNIVHTLWGATDVVDGMRAEELLAGALGSGGEEWLSSRPEF